MTKLLLGLTIGALLFTAAVGAKVVTVQNPMVADLDAGGFRISHASFVGADVISTGGAEIYAGGADPSAGFTATTGSLFLRRVNDDQNVTHGQLWFKTGTFDTDWTCLAGCSP